MCGITGFFSIKHKIDIKKYYTAHLKIAHRGPDDEGFIFKNEKNNFEYLRGNDSIDSVNDEKHILLEKETSLILGHRRLSIIDLSSAGHQPFFYENLYLVYNGEIYNYIELREDLKSLGYEFKTKTDTEVFMKAYHCWGVEAFNKFNGMWAASIFNIEKNELILTRDRFGIKPLYYSNNNGSFYFSSEVKFIKDFISLTLNKKVVREYIDNCCLDFNDETFFNEINELLPGNYLIFNGDSIAIHEYWKFSPKTNKLINYKEAKSKLKKLFKSSLELRMRSDVEVGSLLSGGLDSNAIVGKLIDSKLLKNKIQTFSAVFDEKKYDEKKYIEKVLLKKSENIKGSYVYPVVDELTHKLDEILYYQEFPFRSLAIFSQFEIYNFIKNNTSVKVLLNGQGSDEQFAGYRYHYTYIYAEYILSFKFISLFKELLSSKKIENFNVLKELRNSFKLIIKNKFNKKLLTLRMLSDFKKTPMREYLRYEDRNSMMASVESRLPFLDYRLLEYSLELKNDYKISNGINKKILRDISKNYVLTEIINRKDKMGFVSPQEIWQKNELKEVIISLNDYYEEDERKFIENYYNDQHNNWTKVWRIFCFNYWRKINNIKGK